MKKLRLRHIGDTVEPRPVHVHADAPAWSTKPHPRLAAIETEVDGGDMGEVVRIGGSLWEVVWKREFPSIVAA